MPIWVPQNYRRPQHNCVVGTADAVDAGQAGAGGAGLARAAMLGLAAAVALWHVQD